MAHNIKNGTTGGPLAGVKVLDLTIYQNGPSATAMLADYGAEIIKVESKTGDGVRFLAGPNSRSDGLMAFNRGKKSITIDLKHKDAKTVMKKLVEWADVMCENFRPGVLDKLGYPYEVVSKWNPGIILAANSGFGPDGDWATRPSYDAVAQAFSGAAVWNGGGPSHRPRVLPWTFSDEVGAMNFYSSILAALYAREKNNGIGQQVLTSQVGATLNFQRATLQGSIKNKRQRDNGKEPGAAAAHSQQLQLTGDKKWIIISMAQKAQFQRFCNHVINRPDLATNPLYEKFPLIRGSENKQDFINEIGREIAKNTREYWLNLATKNSVPMAPCATYGEIGDENDTVGKHLFDNKYLTKINHREWGEMTVVAPATRYSQTSVKLPDESESWHEPLLGENSDEVLAMVGFTANEREKLQVQNGPVPPPAGPYAKKLKSSL